MSFKAKDGSVIYLNSRLVPEFDWYLIVEQVNDPASERVENALLINILVSLLISIIVLIIAPFALRGYQGRLETMASRDKLTGVTSRQVFDSLFQQALASCQRKNQPLSVALLDIDHFKQVNDSHGHGQGDHVLQRVAHIIQLHIRDSDVVCRWGGEEFLLMLTNCSQQDAVERVEALRKAIAAWLFELEQTRIAVTVSAGVAQYRDDEVMSALIERADKALYQAKDAGRNCLRAAA